MKKTLNRSKKSKKGQKQKGPQPNGIHKNGQSNRLKKLDKSKTMIINKKSNKSQKSKTATP
jgi:hypothetical protein